MTDFAASPNPRRDLAVVRRVDRESLRGDSGSVSVVRS